MPTVNDATAKRLAQLMAMDAWSKSEEHHTKSLTRVKHMLQHTIAGELRYGVEYKVRYQKATSALSLGFTGGIMVASLAAGAAVTGGSKGIGTPFALAGIAAGTWAANQVAEATVGIVRNQYRKKRIRSWLQTYQEADAQLFSGKKIKVEVDASDSIRRAIDHFRKAASASNALGTAFQKHKGIRDCDGAVELSKALFKYVH